MADPGVAKVVAIAVILLRWIHGKYCGVFLVSNITNEEICETRHNFNQKFTLLNQVGIGFYMTFL